MTADLVSMLSIVFFQKMYNSFHSKGMTYIVGQPEAN